MKLLTLTSLFALTSLVSAQGSAGSTCNPGPSAYICQAVSSFDNGNAFVLVCSASGVWELSAECACPSCCEDTDSGAYCT
ncbi:uncharacterized protein STEHIDRAFT_122248 [Stereum hirsutum FP-91666 SS1]|uniref:uncharacterized protein n=1 Tax=Stereum hirsutum (strain FP-91666) TaxID=721885 RepID=UPI0004449787|nr:uncharacterized protein STEHIDRAFT_122248 [Stereum hirsutum FP-91666 SS1]EIM85204.1 hypothetical protein STEHIDRAFT_122248 [Stereum hirsutum FP-91666 SS1]